MKIAPKVIKISKVQSQNVVKTKKTKEGLLFSTLKFSPKKPRDKENQNKLLESVTTFERLSVNISFGAEK